MPPRTSKKTAPSKKLKPNAAATLEPPSSAPVAKAAAPAKVVEAPPPAAPSGEKERERGRRSDPGYKQVGAYLPEALYKEVKRKLLDEEGEPNFSELVERLLREYVGK